MTLQGKVALVTGSNSGMGRAIAVTLAQDGADVVITYHSDEQGAQNTRQQVEATGRRAVTVQADLTDPDAVRRLFERARAELGPIDILVNNAGVGAGQLMEGTLEDWDTAVNTNLRGAWLCAQEAARDMQTKGWGRIINISSVSGKKPGGIYGVSKAGLDMLTRGLAKELTSKGINVNGISPGLVYTPMTAERIDRDPEKSAQRQPVGRVGDPMDIANMARFLASEQASYMSGSDIVIDGGSLAQGS